MNALDITIVITKAITIVIDIRYVLNQDIYVRAVVGGMFYFHTLSIPFPPQHSCPHPLGQSTLLPSLPTPPPTPTF